MLSKNATMTILVILSMVLFTSTTTNALALSNETEIIGLDLKNKHYAIKDDMVILDSLIGPIKISMPDKVKAELDALKVENERSSKLITRQSFFDDIHSHAADFFECNEQAQIALSTHSENFRSWEAFFKRNSINDTISVRYCCNLLEYVENAQMSLSPACRDQVRLQDHVLTNSEIRYTCRQYEFNSAECFLVRWMYWWIPFIALVLIGLCILSCCCVMKSRREKSLNNFKPSKERKALVTGSAV